MQAADLIQEYEAKIAALERMVGRQALEIELLKGALKHAPRPRSANYLRRHRPGGISVTRGCELMGLARSTFYDTSACSAGRRLNSSPGSARSATSSSATAIGASGRRCATRASW